MGIFKCCCACEGCGRGQLDSWTVGGNASPKTRWKFQNYYQTQSLFSNYISTVTPPPCGECERYFSGVSDTGISSTTFEGWTEWKWGLNYHCAFDVDGDIVCQPYRAFFAIRSVFTPTWRILSGKSYRDCESANPEECNYLVIAKLTGYFMVYRAFWRGAPTACGSPPTYPEVSDIPDRSLWSAGARSGDFSFGSEWGFTPRRVFGGPFSGSIITTDFTLIRARTVNNIAESRADIAEATGNCGLILVPSKHKALCCSIWDCPAGTIDCSGDPSLTVSISTSPFEFDGCSFSTIGGISTATPSWEISGGDWSLYDVA